MVDTGSEHSSSFQPFIFLFWHMKLIRMMRIFGSCWVTIGTWWTPSGQSHPDPHRDLTKEFPFYLLHFVLPSPTLMLAHTPSVPESLSWPPCLPDPTMTSQEGGKDRLRDHLPRTPPSFISPPASTPYSSTVRPAFLTIKPWIYVARGVSRSVYPLQQQGVFYGFHFCVFVSKDFCGHVRV